MPPRDNPGHPPGHPLGHPHKFDPSNAAKLEQPDRQRVLPNGRVVSLLDLRGNETVVDYGAGSGVLTVPVAEKLPGGTVYAVEENPEMMRLLEQRLSEYDPGNVYLHPIEDNNVALADRCVDRVLAVNLLHEVVGEKALSEMRRLLKTDGFLLAVDWRSDVEREMGPPPDVSITQEQGKEMLKEAGFAVTLIYEGEFPYHFVLVGRVPAGA